MEKILTAKIDGRQMEDDFEIIEAILESRNIDDVASFLRPTEEDLIPFEKMKGLDEAYQIIDDAVTMGEKFLVLADVDADGCCSNAIITKYLRRCGADVECIINDGKEHGAENLDLSLLADIDVMIIVDSLNNDPEVYKRILDTGTRLIVFDHHLPEQRLFDANLDFVLVTSAKDYPNEALSGAGVCMKYVLYADEMNLTDYSDDLWVYAAIGLIADMSDMSVPENRYIAHRGLAQFKNPMVKKMVGNYAFDSQSVSFSIGPLVNAAMRMHENEKAMQVFLADDEDEINELVKDLKDCKEQQNEVVAELLDGLLEQGEAQLDRKCMFFMLENDTEAEITGLLGNRLLALYQRPLFILRLKDGQYAGSMRAVGVDNMLEISNSTGLCLCQGHPLASGAFIKEEEFEQFKEVIEEELKDIEFSIKIEADIELTPGQINENLIKQLNAINRISGTGFPPVKVLVRTNDYEVSTFSSKKHLKVIDNETGVIIVKWNCMDWQTMSNDGEIIAIGVLANPYYGRNKFLQLTIDEYTQQND
ncbi:MAG: DHH family phosphoesterase [Bacteroidales bacterium]|nr:DHH family phosphoesterase [Bacteroidales bacterium]